MNPAASADSRDVEPHGLVEMRPQSECECSAFRIPDAVVIRRLNAEGVVAGRNVGVVGRAPGARFCPLMIEAVEHVPVTHFLRSGKAESCVIELEVIMSCRNLQSVRSMQWLVHIVGGKTHQGHRRRQRIHGEVGRIRGNQSLRRRKPNPTVARAPCGRVAVRSHFASAQAVGRAKLHPMRAAASHVAVAARNAILGSEP